MNSGLKLVIRNSFMLLRTEERESLRYKLSGMKDYDVLSAKGMASKHAEDNLGSWGHEFVRSLAGEIGQEYNSRVIDGADPDTDDPFTDLLGMVDIIVPFHVTHNAEAEAVDLLIEVQRLKNLLALDTIDETNYERICLYLLRTADYMSDPEDYVVSWYRRFVLASQIGSDTFDRKCWKQRLRSTKSKGNTMMLSGLR